ncbi:MAG: DUF4012 domain-containing protein [Patescibacteria group bacterium]
MRFRYLKYIFFTFIATLFLLCIFSIPYVLSIKQIYSNSMEGKKNLEQGVDLIKSQNLKHAIILSQTAEKGFSSATNELQDLKNSFLISRISYLESQCNNLQYLIKTAEILSKAAQQSARIGEELKNILEGNVSSNFFSWTEQEKNKVLKLIYESGPELNGIKANLDLALLNLEKIQNKGLIKLLFKKIEQLKIQLSYSTTIISKIIPIAEIFPALAGYPEQANYLVLFQNSDELRPTGGFLGSYGILKTKNGNIIEFDTDDIYNLDRQAENILSIAPPDAFRKYMGMNKWFIRDANWSPDWPTSAKKIDWFYEQESKFLDKKDSTDIDGVIAITPQFVADLIAIAGTVVINNEEFNQNNFRELLQYKVEKEYAELGLPKHRRKEVIGKILQELKIKLFDLPSERWPEIINVINKNIAEKNILVFFKNIELQKLSENIGIAGEVKKVINSDYLMVVDANLRSLKTDAAMKKNIEYNLEQNNDGLFVQLKVNYKHQGGTDWKTSRYRSWTRIYVPLGSKLISAEMNNVKLDDNIEIKNELDKTYFGVFISIEPGSAGSLLLKYKLPNSLFDELIKNKKYNLYIQKQPGNRTGELIVNMNFTEPIQLYSPEEFNIKENNNIQWKSDLMVDKEFKIRIK